MQRQLIMLSLIGVLGCCACDPKQPDAKASSPSGDAQGKPDEPAKPGSAQAPTVADDGTPRFNKEQLATLCDHFTPELVASVTGIAAGQWQVSRERRGCRLFTKSGSVASLGIAIKKDVPIAKRIYAETLAPKDQAAQGGEARAEVKGGLAKQGLDEQGQGAGMAMGGEAVAKLKVQGDLAKVEGIGDEAYFDQSVKEVSLMGQAVSSPANTLSVRVSNALFSIYVAKDPKVKDQAVVESLAKGFIGKLP